MNPGYAGRT